MPQYLNIGYLWKNKFLRKEENQLGYFFCRGLLGDFSLKNNTSC